MMMILAKLNVFVCFKERKMFIPSFLLFVELACKNLKKKIERVPTFSSLRMSKNRNVFAFKTKKALLINNYEL